MMHCQQGPLAVFELFPVHFLFEFSSDFGQLGDELQTMNSAVGRTNLLSRNVKIVPMWVVHSNQVHDESHSDVTHFVDLWTSQCSELPRIHDIHRAVSVVDNDHATMKFPFRADNGSWDTANLAFHECNMRLVRLITTH